MSSYLEPQESINEDEIANKLITHPFFTEEDSYFKEMNEKEIPQSFCHQIIESLNEKNVAISPSDMKPKISYDGYTWTQKNDKISIHYNFKSPNSDKSVKIQDDTIKSGSGFIIGRFYRKPQEVSTIGNDLSITIELTVKESWPILIAEGIPDIDPDSSFLLGVAAQKLNFIDFSNRFFLYAAMKGHILSMAALTYHYFSLSDEKKLFYWNVKLYLSQVIEMTSFVQICDELTKQKDNGESAKLAESILINEAKKDIPIAYLYLGYLHMKTISGFQSDRKLAIRYFETAANQYNNKKAYETLGKCYIGGIGVERNFERGIELLHKANLKNESIHEILRLEKEKIEKLEQIRKKNRIKTIIATSSITFIMLTSVFVGLEFFSRRNKK